MFVITHHFSEVNINCAIFFFLYFSVIIEFYNLHFLYTVFLITIIFRLSIWHIRNRKHGKIELVKFFKCLRTFITCVFMVWCRIRVLQMLLVQQQRELSELDKNKRDLTTHSEQLIAKYHDATEHQTTIVSRCLRFSDTFLLF